MRTKLTAFFFSVLALVGGTAFAANVSTDGWKTYVSESPCCGASATKESPLPGISFKYPGNWDLQGSVFFSGQEKVGEFLPGLYRLGQGEECFSKEGPMPNAKDLKVAGLKGKKVVTVSYPEGPPGQKSGTWYPHRYCVSSRGFAYQMFFYEWTSNSGAEKTFDTVISSFRFFKAAKKDLK